MTDIALPELYDGPVTSRIELSRILCDTFRPLLESDDWLKKNLSLLKTYAGELDDHMEAMEMGVLCTQCASKPSGGCCSLYMSGETDSVQMALNGLAGVEVGTVCENGTDCLFLGQRGCTFLFKPMFCLNYNCSHILNGASPEHLTKLEHLTGRLLSKQYELEQYLLGLLP